MKRGKLNMEIQLKGSKKEAERYEKELNKQLDAYKNLDLQFCELKMSYILSNFILFIFMYFSLSQSRSLQYYYGF